MTIIHDNKSKPRIVIFSCDGCQQNNTSKPKLKHISLNNKEHFCSLSCAYKARKPSNALAGTFAAGNAFITTNVNTISNTVALTAGQIYAFRIQNGNGPGPGSISLTVSSPSLPVTSNLTSLSLYNPNTLGI